jgi:capsule polysaccharide export protein KpsE/RkpR
MITQADPIVVRSEREDEIALFSSRAPNWVYNLRILWAHRKLLLKATGIALVVSLIIVLIIPKTYESEARIMPPESGASNSALLAALAGRSLEGEFLGGLAASLMGGHNSGALFIDLLRSGSVAGKLIDRFQLQSVYHKRYRTDAAKVLARNTTVTQDKKSGVISLSVKDHDPARAQAMVKAYLDELNAIVNRTSTSSAHQERVFIEARLAGVKAQLERAQQALSEFSSTNSTIDLREQARATVESEARLQGELIAAQSELNSLRQVYGDGNIRVRASEARAATLKRELEKMGGSASPLGTPAENTTRSDGPSGSEHPESYLPLRQVPRLAVPYANLYREVHVQETVYDLLTQQYEVARIQEAKDVPAVNIIDAPGIPEKKSFPPRALLTLAFTLVFFLAFSAILIFRGHWRIVRADDPRKAFALDVMQETNSMVRRAIRFNRRAE